MSITFSHKGTDCTCRSSSHSALAHRIRRKGDEVAVFVGKIRIDGGVVRQHQ